jgi:hypothetical protein
LVGFHLFLLVLCHGFQHSYGGYQTFEICHIYLSPGFRSNGAQFTTQSNESSSQYSPTYDISCHVYECL